MKTFSFGVALVVSALVIGCQNSNNDPLSAINGSTPALSKQSSNPDGVINLKHTVYKEVGESVGTLNDYFIYGSIVYTLVGFEENHFTLSLVSEMSVQSGASKSVGSAYAESIEDLEIPINGSVSVLKSFTVKAGEESLRLYVELKISAEAVELASIRLLDDMAGRSIKLAQ